MDIDTAELLAGQIESREMNLKTLFAEDPARAEKMTVSAAGWTLDYSKNLVDEPTMKLLVRLAEKANLKQEIEAMFNGVHINKTEDRAVLHT
ncbi:MAG: glucose-6-phosphate isomerase, partial [bacterium]|nr:glucose-6-phosphate isomerase [bacterium]